jgi:hypothetical protein
MHGSSTRWARFSEAWYQLSEEERNSLKAKHDEAFEKAGAKRPIICDSSWSSDQWSFAGVEEFPNIEAVQDYMAALNELNWFRYVELQAYWARNSKSK